MSRYIDEDLVNFKLKQICDKSNTSYGIQFGGRAKDFAQLTDDIPTADVAEVKCGKWIKTNDSNKLRCSQCDVIHLIAQYPHGEINYCPNCGAKMGEMKASNSKYYYKVTDNKTKESLYVCINILVKSEKLIEFMGIGAVFKNGAEVQQISKEEYEEETE